MGLDQYLNKMPRYKNTTANDVSLISSFFDWLREKEKGDEYANCTFRQWSGCDIEKLPDKETINFYEQHYQKDDKYKFIDIWSCMEEVAYWRKANAIHRWFVNHVQDGTDDCCYHNEVTKEILEELLDTCEEVINLCTYIDEDNIIVPYQARELLETQGGFFFGTIEYDNWYYESIKDTIDQITKILETTDFEKEMIYYVSSW